jgi:hypothetical protein
MMTYQQASGVSALVIVRKFSGQPSVRSWAISGQLPPDPAHLGPVRPDESA